MYKSAYAKQTLKYATAKKCENHHHKLVSGKYYLLKQPSMRTCKMYYSILLNGISNNISHTCKPEDQISCYVCT